MIFRTITDDITGANKSIGLFGKSLNDFKGIINSSKQNGFVSTLLNTPLINIDTDAIDNYNDAIKSDMPYEQALAEARSTTNAETIALIESSNGLEVQTERVSAAQKASTIAAKAQSMALKAASIAGNMIAFTVITKGIELVVKGFDNWIHRVEKANEAMKDAVGEYESAKSSLENVNSELDEQNKRLDELLAKDKLTYAEQGQLEELQAITKELLLQQDIEERRADKTSKEAADKAVDAYKKQYGRYDKTEEDLQEKLSYENFPIPEGADDVLGMIAAYTRAKELLEQSQKEFDEAAKNGEDTTLLADDVQLNIDAVNDYKQSLDENLSDLQEKRLVLEDEYNKAIEKRESGAEPLTSSEKEIIETYESIYDVMKMIYEYTDPTAWKSMQIESVFDTEGIEKTKEELVEMVKAGEFDESTLQSYPKLSEALEQNEISASELRNELEALAEAEKDVTGDTFNDESPISFSDQFKSLWDSESFEDAQKDLTKLAKESGITAKDIHSLASENEELALLLEDSGISAQFAATCFQRVCNGENGFAAITDDARALDQVLHEMDDSLQSVAVSKSAYDKAMEQDDYNAEFENYQEAYKSAMEMFENGDYGKHFRSTMEYLLGDDSYTMSIEEMYNSIKNLKSVFGEDSTNGLEFLDKLYDKKDILDDRGSSLKKLSDGSYKFDLKPDEFEEIGQALGMTADEVAACTNALGMFGDNKSYDIDKLESTLKDMSVAARDGKESILSLQGVESILSNLGYNGYEIYSIMQDIQGMDGIKLIDFSAEDENSLRAIITQLKELDMIEFNGSSINVDALIENLRNSFSMASEDIEAFIQNLSKNCNYSFSDTEGKGLSLNEAIEKVQTSENDALTKSIDETGESAENATGKVQELNGQNTTGIRNEFVLLKGAIGDVVNGIGSAIKQVDEFNSKKLPTVGGQQETSQTSMTTGKAGSVVGNTVKNITGKAHASGSIGIPKDETALINELGNETIIDPKSGTYEVVEGGAQFRKLKKGQIVLNHLQTKALLAKGKISSFGKMMFRGNASLKGDSYALGTAGGNNQATNKPYEGISNNNSKSTDDNSNNSSKEETEKEFSKIFDWFERRIKKFQKSFDKWIKQAETAVTSGFINKYYNKAISSAKSQLSTYSDAYNRYMAEANAVGLDEKYAKKVRNGTLDIETIYAKGSEEDIKEYEENAEKIKKYQDWWDKAQDSMDSFMETAEKLYNLPLDKAATKIEKFNDSIDLLDKKLSNAIGSDNKNKLIDQQKKQEKNILNAYKTARTESKKSLNSAKKELKKNKNLDADDGITAKEKKKILAAMKKNQEVNLSFFKEGTAGYKEAVKYNEALKANKKAIYDAQTAQADYNRYLVKSAKQKFDNIADDYNKEVQKLGWDMSKLDNKISQIEAAGKKVNISYYKSQKDINDQKLAQYKAEKTALEKNLKNIKKGTDEWYDAKDEIQHVKNAISDCAKETYELNNAINQLHFDLFDDVSDGIKRIITEQEFLQGLFAHEKNTDDKTGKFTNAGLAKLGSLSASYYASKENADRDKAMLDDLKKVKSKGKQKDGTYKLGDWTFNSLDDLQKKIDEVYTKWQDDIKETYSLESSIVDLMKEKYQAELDLLKDLIDAKKEALNAEKDLHDYQRTINDKTKDITTLQKQIAAYSGDTSQEGMAKLQKLQNELTDKQDDLRETEYDKYISDQQDMLDKLYAEYEDLLSKKLEDFMMLVQEGLTISNDNTATIKTYLGEIAKKYGYKIETGGLFDSSYRNRNKGIRENVEETVSGIDKNKTKRSGTEDKVSNSGTNFKSRQDGDTTVLVAQRERQYGDTTVLTEKRDRSKDRNIVKDYISSHADKAKKDKKEYSDINQKIYENKAKSYKGTGKVLSSKELKGLAKKLGVNYDGASKTGNLYKVLKGIKFPGFKKGGVVSADKIHKQIKANGDDGIVSVKNGEGILTQLQTAEFMKLAEEMPEMLKNAASIDRMLPISRSMSEISNARNMNNVVNIDNITLPNVTNYDEFKDRMFKDMQNDRKYLQFTKDASVNLLDGAGRLAKNRTRF